MVWPLHLSVLMNDAVGPVSQSKGGVAFTSVRSRKGVLACTLVGYSKGGVAFRTVSLIRGSAGFKNDRAPCTVCVESLSCISYY